MKWIPTKIRVEALIYNIILIEGSLKSNFRQYGEMKSRAGQRQRQDKDQKREE
jgi:hypothetical protein